jgi:hypothetical protein
MHPENITDEQFQKLMEIYWEMENNMINKQKIETTFIDCFGKQEIYFREKVLKIKKYVEEHKEYYKEHEAEILMKAYLKQRQDVDQKSMTIVDKFNQSFDREERVYLFSLMTDEQITQIESSHNVPIKIIN